MRALALALLAGCASAPPAAPLAAPWPARPAGYDDAYQRWTRRGQDHQDLVQTLAVSATLEGAEFRAAYTRERARRLGLSADEEEQLVAEQRAAAAEYWDVELLVATAFPDENDLKKHGRKQSIWHVALIADDGRQVAPISIHADKRQRDDLERWFPDLKPFYVPYRVRFPRTSADGRPLVAPGARRLSLEVASALGKVILVWAAAGG